MMIHWLYSQFSTKAVLFQKTWIHYDVKCKLSSAPSFIKSSTSCLPFAQERAVWVWPPSYLNNSQREIERSSFNNPIQLDIISLRCLCTTEVILRWSACIYIVSAFPEWHLTTLGEQAWACSLYVLAEKQLVEATAALYHNIQHVLWLCHIQVCWGHCWWRNQYIFLFLWLLNISTKLSGSQLHVDPVCTTQEFDIFKSCFCWKEFCCQTQL